jgi:DNA mismatch repair protein MutS
VNLDKITLSDLSFFNAEHSIFDLINRCTTQAGSDMLRRLVQSPAPAYERLKAQQDAVRFWLQHLDSWTGLISNGTLVMIEKFYESADGIVGRPGTLGLKINSWLQKVFNKNAYSFVRFSVSHLIDFLKGCNELLRLLDENPPELVREELEGFRKAFELPLIQSLLNTSSNASQPVLIDLSYRSRREIKHVVYQLIERYARMDACQSMARATAEHHWHMPVLLPAEELHYEAAGLYHPLLREPVAYDLVFSRDKNFLFLTGANMSGKSTLIRSLGVGAVLAHIGMGVPAQAMKISFLEGIITNMHVEDNILLGESYFFAEVQRMKLTARKLSSNRYNLVLMDELFKGTNVHDAYECSRAVVDGLLHQQYNLMALSTHLNELSENLTEQPRIWFRYCYTRITGDGHYEFTYQLREGVSKDRIGYLVLKNEGVLDLLRK